jgi:S1-C subfamily serine protease
LAVLKIESEKEFVPAIIGDTSLIKLGDEIYAAGNPYGLGVTLSKGIVSATGRDYGNPYLELIQTDAAINPGNSGGALLNSFGHLIGINTKIFSQTGGFQGISFAIPVDKIIKISSEIIQNGSAKRAWIGNFRVKPKRILLNKNPTSTLEIISSDDGPLFRDSDIKVGDMIIGINNKPATWENFVFYLNSAFPGDTLELDIFSEEKINKIFVKTEAG